MIYAKTPFKGSFCWFARIHVDGCLLSRSHNIAGAYTHHSFVDATFFVFDSFIMCNVMTKTCILLNRTGSCIPFFFVLVLIFFSLLGEYFQRFFFQSFLGYAPVLFVGCCFIWYNIFSYMLPSYPWICTYICTCMFMAFMKHT